MRNIVSILTLSVITFFLLSAEFPKKKKIFIILCILAICIQHNLNAQQNVPWLIHPQFDEARNFFEGLAYVVKDGEYGFINKKGKFVIAPQFDDAYHFHEGVARVVKDGKYGFIKNPLRKL